MNLTKINIKEKEFHNKLHSHNGARKENIFYKSIFNLYKDFYEYLEKNARNKTILDYGCGTGSITEKIARFNPSRIVGIDISEVSVNKAIEKAKKLKLEIEYKVDNCESSSFESNTFDLIYGTGILHHLKLELSLREINRILKKNGTMIFIEPLGTNPFINFYRKLTPGSRSEDEHPFVWKDFNLLKEIYDETDCKYYGFFTLIFFLFYKNPEKSSFFKTLTKIDNLIFKIKFLRFLAWSVLITAKKT